MVSGRLRVLKTEEQHQSYNEKRFIDVLVSFVF